jgi:hypothetical protein
LKAHEFQYTSFDLLWWVLDRLLHRPPSQVRRIPAGGSPSAPLGLGLETKYAIVFYIAGNSCRPRLSPARRFLKTGWFWAGVALALLIFLPNFIWLAATTSSPTTSSSTSICATSAKAAPAASSSGQFFVCANLAAAPLWIAGLIGFLRDRRYRMIAFMYLVPLAIFWVGKGRNYYMAPAYPMLLAMGAVLAERWLRTLPRWGRVTIASVYFAASHCLGLRLRAASAARIERPAQAICPQPQLRSARRDRLGRSRPHRRADPRLPAARSAGASRHHHRQLRRVRRN